MISQSAAASSVASTGSNFSWGSDDTSTLQSVATQVVSNAAAPTSVVLPCGATTIRGYFIRRGIASVNTTQAFPIGVSGCASEGTVIVMTPDSSCPSKTDAPGCFFSDNYIGGNSYSQLGMGDRLSNLLITGLGFDNFVGSSFANNQAVIYIAGYSELDNVWVNGFAWDQSATPSNVTYGIQTYYTDGNLVWGGGVLINSGSWLGGDWACAFGGGGYTPTIAYGGYCGGTEFDAVVLSGANTVQLNDMVLVNGDYTAGGYNQCAALYASSSAPSTGLSAFTGSFSDNGSLMYGAAYIYGGTLRFTNDLLTSNTFGPACSQPRSIYIDGSAATVYAQNANFGPGNPSATTILAGTLYDLGGNAIGPLSLTGGQIIADGHSLFGGCTGAASPSATLGLFGTGPNVTATTCTSTTIGTGILMNGTRTLRNLVVNASHAGVNSSSGVVTVLRNGSSTAITCTLGTTTLCVDGTHSVTVSPGDLISVEFTTQTSETLAGVQAFVEWN